MVTELQNLLKYTSWSVKLRRCAVWTREALYQNFAEAGTFSGSIQDDRVWNKVSTIKCLLRMAKNVQAYMSTPTSKTTAKKYEFQNCFILNQSQHLG